MDYGVAGKGEKREKLVSKMLQFDENKTEIKV